MRLCILMMIVVISLPVPTYRLLFVIAAVVIVNVVVI